MPLLGGRSVSQSTFDAYNAGRIKPIVYPAKLPPKLPPSVIAAPRSTSAAPRPNTPGFQARAPIKIAKPPSGWGRKVAGQPVPTPTSVGMPAPVKRPLMDRLNYWKDKLQNKDQYSPEEGVKIEAHVAEEAAKVESGVENYYERQGKIAEKALELKDQMDALKALEKAQRKVRKTGVQV